MTRFTLWLWFVLVCLLVPGVALGATRTVCASGCDHTTIKLAIAAATAGDTIQVAGETFTDNNIQVNKSLIISGAGASTIVQAQVNPQTAITPAIFVISTGVTVTMQDMLIRHAWNSGGNGGGVDNGGTLTLLRVTLDRNQANAGSAVYNRATGNLTINQSTVKNSVGLSVAVYNVGTMTISQSLIFNNEGDGVFSNGPNSQIVETTVSSNNSTGVRGPITVIRSAIVANSQGVASGGHLINTTIAYNQQRGIENTGSTFNIMRLDNCTVFRNGSESTGSQGAGIYNTGSNEVRLRNTIVAENLQVGEASDCLGQIDSYGYLLISSLSGCSLGIWDTGDIFEQDARLDFLRDNGGPTVTAALLDDSPAIDAGSCTDMAGATVTLDQRGVLRPQNAVCDIGAYEYNGAPPGNQFSCWDFNENNVCNLATEDVNGDGNCTPSDCQGEDGLTCWDLNGNRACNVAAEDLNGDGTCNLLDCRGAPGPQGPACWDLNGNNACNANEDKNADLLCNVLDCRGVDGYSCWDLDRDYICDAAENVNGDGDCTPLDCRGTPGLPGSPGSPGTSGVACWDLNANGVCNTASEDANSDAACNVLDCRGAQGLGGISCWDLNSNRICDPVEDNSGDSTCTVADCHGANGFNCWDLDEDYVCDPNEDTNLDSDCTPVDCRGTVGAPGAPGTPGSAGIHCWDLNGNGACNAAAEDANVDGSCNVLDCRGAQGTNGLSCWDANSNRICDPAEDLSGDLQCTVIDCLGGNGYNCWDIDQDYICDPSEDENGDDDCTTADCLGPVGPQGPMGATCWDLNANGTCDPAEDQNGDLSCTLLDCRGAAGTSGFSCWDLNTNNICDAAEDQDGDLSCTLSDCRGLTGYTCWDQDEDYTCDQDEDENGDTDCTVLDCRGPTGATGANCWDLNASGVCDVANEDLDGDLECTLLDCRGQDGASGFSCWDLNTNSICDPSEDPNTDEVCNVLDCRGADGSDGASCWDLNANLDCDPDEDADGDGDCTVADCAGQDGVSALTRVSEEPAGDNCVNGGVKIEIGIETNGNAVLDDEEVQDTQYACNGLNGVTSGVEPGEDSGCGCRVGRSGTSGAWLLFALSMIGLARRRGLYQR